MGLYFGGGLFKNYAAFLIGTGSPPESPSIQPLWAEAQAAEPAMGSTLMSMSSDDSWPEPQSLRLRGAGPNCTLENRPWTLESHMSQTPPAIPSLSDLTDPLDTCSCIIPHSPCVPLYRSNCVSITGDFTLEILLIVFFCFLMVFVWFRFSLLITSLFQ